MWIIECTVQDTAPSVHHEQHMHCSNVFQILPASPHIVYVTLHHHTPVSYFSPCPCTQVEDPAVIKVNTTTPATWHQQESGRQGTGCMVWLPTWPFTTSAFFGPVLMVWRRGHMIYWSNLDSMSQYRNKFMGLSNTQVQAGGVCIAVHCNPYIFPFILYRFCVSGNEH